MTLDRPTLALRSRAVLIAAAEYWRLHLHAPSMRDLAAILRWSTVSMVEYHLTTLTKAGLVSSKPGAPRTLTLTPEGWRASGLTAPRLDVHCVTCNDSKRVWCMDQSMDEHGCDAGGTVSCPDCSDLNGKNGRYPC